MEYRIAEITKAQLIGRNVSDRELIFCSKIKHIAKSCVIVGKCKRKANYNEECKSDELKRNIKNRVPFAKSGKALLSIGAWHTVGGCTFF